MKIKGILIAAVMALSLCVPIQTVQATCVGAHRIISSCGGSHGVTTGGITHLYSGGSHLYGEISHKRKATCIYCPYEVYTEGGS